MDSLSLIGIYQDRQSRGRERQVVCTQFYSWLLLFSLQAWGYVLISKSYSFCRWQNNFKPWTPEVFSWLPRVFLSFALTRLQPSASPVWFPNTSNSCLPRGLHVCFCIFFQDFYILLIWSSATTSKPASPQTPLSSLPVLSLCYFYHVTDYIWKLILLSNSLTRV